MKRAAEHGDLAANGAPARETRDALRHDRVDGRPRDVLARNPLVEKRPHVHLGEHGATRGDRIDGLATVRVIVQLLGVDVEHAGYGVDETARPARARAVHAQLLAACDEEDLRILPAYLDGDVGIRKQPAERALRHATTSWVKGTSSISGETHARRARDP